MQPLRPSVLQAPKVDHQCAVKEYSGSAADKVTFPRRESLHSCKSFQCSPLPLLFSHPIPLLSLFQVADLPHHLRPESILLMTMDYLVTSVMDAGEGRVELWYDFIWNRTRAIRKVPIIDTAIFHTRRSHNDRGFLINNV